MHFSDSLMVNISVDIHQIIRQRSHRCCHKFIALEPHVTCVHYFVCKEVNPHHSRNDKCYNIWDGLKDWVIWTRRWSILLYMVFHRNARKKRLSGIPTLVGSIINPKSECSFFKEAIDNRRTIARNVSSRFHNLVFTPSQNVLVGIACRLRPLLSSVLSQIFSSQSKDLRKP